MSPRLEGIVLVLEPKVAHEGRAIFGGIADRLVPPDQVRDLHEHWDEPSIAWYQGGHLTFTRDPDVKSCVHEGPDTVSVLLGDGSGSFTVTQSFSPGATGTLARF